MLRRPLVYFFSKYLPPTFRGSWLTLSFFALNFAIILASREQRQKQWENMRKRNEAKNKT